MLYRASRKNIFENTKKKGEWKKTPKVLNSDPLVLLQMRGILIKGGAGSFWPHSQNLRGWITSCSLQSPIPATMMPFTKLLKEPFLHSQNWVVATPTLPNKCALLCHLRPWKCLPLPPTSLFSHWGPSTERAGQLGAFGRPSVGRRPRWKGHTLLRSWQLCPWWPWAP